MLEKKKLIDYENREMELTKKGKKAYLGIKKEVEPYVRVNRKLKSKSLTSYTRKIQTVFR